MDLTHKCGCVGEDFIVSRCNECAYQACLQAVNGQKSVFVALHGPSSSGKSHLLAEIQQVFAEKYPEKLVLAVNYDEILAKYMEFIRSGKATPRGIRPPDLLIIDNMQFAAGKTATQEQLIHWFSDMLNEGRSVVIAFDRPAKHFEELLGKIRSLYPEQCYVAELPEADAALRNSYLERLLATIPVELPQSVRQSLIHTKEIPLCALRGFLHKLKMLQEQKGQNLTEAEMLKRLEEYQSV